MIKTKKHFRRIHRRTMRQNTRRIRNTRNKNRRNRNRINKKKGGSYIYYSDGDINLFEEYISRLPDDNKKQWLVQNIKRMPYEEHDYEYNFPMTTPPDDFYTEPKYYQGIDRIQGYLRGYGQW